MRVVVGLVVVGAGLAGCGAEDLVDGPFFTDAVLQAKSCPDTKAGQVCFDVLATVAGPAESEVGECEIYALANDFETKLGSPVIITGIEMRPGEPVRFEASVDEVDSGAFLRWQVECSPGPPG